MKKPHLSWLISLPHAMAIVKKFRQKRHRDAGYSFELEEVANQDRVWSSPDRSFYAKYPCSTTVFRLNIYYEKPDETPLPNKVRVAGRKPRQ